MRKKWIAIVAAAVLGTAALAQPGPGYGPGYGPGMMGGGWGPGGGYGPGMMGGYGPGMMGGWGGHGALYGLSDLTADQRKAIDQARQDFWKKQWPLMQAMHSAMWNGEQDLGKPFDDQAARKNYDAIAALQKQMFDNMIEMRKHIDAVLTPKQREELQRAWSR